MSLLILREIQNYRGLKSWHWVPLLSLLGRGSPHLLFHCPAGSRISNRVCGTNTKSCCFPIKNEKQKNLALTLKFNFKFFMLNKL